MAQMEEELMVLGKDIELNQFRIKRGDVRGVEDGVLGVRREEVGRKWAEITKGLVAEVEMWQTGLCGEALKEEEMRLKARLGRQRRAWDKLLGGKL